MIIPMTHNWWWENFSNELVDRQSCGGNFAGPSPWLNQVAQTCIKWGLRREGPPMTYTHREWSSQTYDQYSWYTSGEMIQRTNGYWFYDVQLHWKKSRFSVTNRAHPSGHFQSHGGDWWLPCRLPIRSTIKMHDNVWFVTEGCQACSTTWNRSRSHLVKHWGSWSLAWLSLATYVLQPQSCHKNHCHQRFRCTLFAMQHYCWLSWCRLQWVALWWIN